MKLRKPIALCLSILLLPCQAFAQQPAPKKFELTVDSIMRGPDLVGHAPTEVRWSQDSQRVYFRWKRAGEPRLKEFDLYVVNRDGSGLRKLSEEEARLAPPASGELSKDKKLTVFADEGDIFLYDHAKNERRQVTKTSDGESNPHFTFDQKRIYFTRQNNLYVIALDGGSLVQMTDIRSGGAAPAAETAGVRGARQVGSTSTESQQKGTESQEFIKKEERELLEAVRERAQQREEQEAKRKKRGTRKPFNLPSGQSVSNLSLSPDEKYVIATVSEPGTGGKNTVVPNYVTESGYTEDIPSRNKVGDAQGRSRMAVITVETGEVKFVDHGQTAAARAQSNSQSTPTPPDTAQQTPPLQRATERQVSLFTPLWSEDGKHAVLSARSADNKDRWVMSLDPATAKTRVLFHEHDDAWINGFGGFTLGWMSNNQYLKGDVYFLSERDGFAHLYTVSIDTGEVTQLTTGNFEVSDVRYSKDSSEFYFTSSEAGILNLSEEQRKKLGPPERIGELSGIPYGDPSERHLYKFSGRKRIRLTSMPGNNQAFVSPDESTLAIIRSYSNKPPELYLATNKPGAEAKQVTTSPTEEFFSYNWIDPPIIQFKARDGVMVPARLYKPARVQKGAPAVIFVHGAGYLQNVHKWWSSYYREYMFHHLLVERGFVVIDVDYRGSAGYGRDWRTGIYRHMGGKDLTDQVDAAKYLASEHGVDPKRIGIYGGSYGGFITLMALFTEPDVFAAGAALRPVTDWAHYNHGYTSNILNTPQADVEAYKQSSPIYFAGGLKGALLICHGMVDTNVHFQDTVRLVERLIELHKENWELAVYPVEDHGFERASSWADEYKRILKLFTEHLHGDLKSAPGQQPLRKR
ncbi:MAG TPA: prolyl oligopeptidase family serine peptidase [Blastocatellia bacterium]|nr:prolyl oligopeptidase family serine peptidase [Blastocatellia bacterium]